MGSFLALQQMIENRRGARRLDDLHGNLDMLANENRKVVQAVIVE